MSHHEKRWDEVDRYIGDVLVRPDSRFEAILKNSREAGLPEISVSPAQGKLLELLVRFKRAEAVLEVGTLGGYSTAWLASGLARGGQLITLEINPDYAEVARSNLSLFEFADSVGIRVGKALDLLKKLCELRVQPFDLIFIDADKTEYADYLDWSLKLSRPGTMIIADNVVRDGEVINDRSEDPRVQGVRRFNERIASHPRLSATAIQTVGSKGYDGFALIYVDND